MYKIIDIRTCITPTVKLFFKTFYCLKLSFDIVTYFVGGTIFPIGVKKQLRMQEIAEQNNIPCVYLIDSGGGFLPLQSELFVEGGRVFYNEAIMNSIGIPQVSRTFVHKYLRFFTPFYS